MFFFQKANNKALISLREYAGWSLPLLLANPDEWFLFAAFEAANFQIDFFGNLVMRTAE